MPKYVSVHAHAYLKNHKTENHMVPFSCASIIHYMLLIFSEMLHGSSAHSLLRHVYLEVNAVSIWVEEIVF